MIPCKFSDLDSKLVKPFEFGLAVEATKNKLLGKDEQTLEAALKEVTTREQCFSQEPTRERRAHQVEVDPNTLSEDSGTHEVFRALEGLR